MRPVVFEHNLVPRKQRDVAKVKAELEGAGVLQTHKDRLQINIAHSLRHSLAIVKVQTPCFHFYILPSGACVAVEGIRQRVLSFHFVNANNTDD